MPDVAFLKDLLAVAGNATNSSPRICNPTLCQIQTHFHKYKLKAHIAKYKVADIVLEYVNVSDQTSIFTHETKMLKCDLICWKSFLTFNVLKMTRTDG